MNPSIAAVIEAIENAPAQEQFWNVPKTTAQFLHALVKIMEAKTVLEIGTSNGYSGLYLADALATMGGVLYTVESHRKRFALAQENFQKAGVSEFVRQVFGHAPEVFESGKFFHEAMPIFDLVFFDATKMEYESYMKAVQGFLRPGGLLVADNVVSHAQEMKGFLEKISAERVFESVTLPFDNGILLAKKKV